MKEIIKDKLKEVMQIDNKILSEAMKLEIEQSVIDIVEGKKSLRHAFKIPHELMQAYYARGNALFKAGQYAKAAEVFNSLHQIDPPNAVFSFALAATYFHQKDYEKACANFIIAKEADKNDPEAPFYLYNCLLKLDRPLIALNALLEVLDRASRDVKFSHIYEKAKLEYDYLVQNSIDWILKQQN